MFQNTLFNGKNIIIIKTLLEKRPEKYKCLCPYCQYSNRDQELVFFSYFLDATAIGKNM